LAVALLTLAVIVALSIAPVLGQVGDGPSPIPAKASVIAQGVAALAENDLAWRVTRATAPPSAASPRGVPGFLLVDSGVLLVNDPKSASRSRLSPGEAAYAPTGAQIKEATLEDPAAWYRIDLVAAGDAANPGSDEIAFVGQPFVAPRGDRDLELARQVLDAGETVDLALESQEAPVLLFVTTGGVELSPASNPATAPVPLPAGQGAALGGDVIVRATDAGATFVMAIIGPDIAARRPQAASPTPSPTATPALGSLTLQALACPVAYDGDQYGADCVVPLADVAFGLFGDATGFASEGTTGADGFTGFADLQPDSYTISGGVPGEFATRIVACDAVSAEADQGATVAIEAGSAVTCTWYVIPEDLRGDGAGTVTVTVHYCPGTPIDPFTDCAAGDASGAIIEGPVALTLDASGAGGGLTYGSYVLQAGGIAAPEGYELSEIRGVGDGASFAIDEANPDAVVNVIFVPASGGSENAGADTDGDGLSDERETRIGADPANPDSDGDGFMDGAEVQAGSNPLIPENAAPGDDGGAIEPAPFDPAIPPDPTSPVMDSDGDGLLDGQEAELGTDPTVTDTDGDGLSDTAEVGLAAGAAIDTDPTLADTDGDGVGDGVELGSGTNPADPASS